MSYEDHLTNQEVHNRIQNATRVHDDLLTMVKKNETQMVWQPLKILWHGEDNSAGNSKRRKRRQNRRKDGKITSRIVQERSLEIP